MSSFSIKVKNKYLVLFALLLVVAVGWTNANGKDYLFNSAQKARRSNDPVKALAYYDKFLSEYPEDPRVPEALYWSADLLPDEEDFRAEFFPHRSGISRRNGAVPELPEGALTREERLWRIYEEFPDHWANWHVPFKLAEALNSRGETRKAKQLYEETLYNDQASRRVDAAFALIDMYLSVQAFDEAWLVLQYTQENLEHHLAVQQQFKKGDILKAQGDFAGAREAYNEVLAIFAAEEEWTKRQRPDKDEKPDVADSTLYHYQEEVKQRIKLLGETSETPEYAFVKGRVVRTGEPIGGVRVILRQSMDSWFSNPARDPLASIQTTDDEGNFSFQALAGEKYEVGIELNYAQAQVVEGYHLQILGGVFALRPDDEQIVHFSFVPPVKLRAPGPGYVYSGGLLAIEWEPYENAHSYRVSLGAVTYTEGGYSTQGIGHTPHDVEENSTTLTQEAIGATPFGSISADQQGVNPIVYLGMLKAADDLTIRVDALDEDGRTISSSAGLFFGNGISANTLLQLAKPKLRIEEKMLLDREYDQAVEALEARLQAEPNDQYALDLLYRIYFAGTYNKSDNWEEEDLAHKDLAKSLELLERLVALDASPENLKNLTALYRAQGLEEKLFATYKRLEEAGAADAQVYRGLAEHALDVDDAYEKALAYYRKAQDFSPEYYGYQSHFALLVVSGLHEEASRLLSGLKITHGSELVLDLKKAWQAYVDSAWSSKGDGDYLRAYNGSFQEAKEGWDQSTGAHGKFLKTFVGIGEDDYYRRRDELQQELRDFQVEYVNSAPELVDLLEAFAKTRYL